MLSVRVFLLFAMLGLIGHANADCTIVVSLNEKESDDRYVSWVASGTGCIKTQGIGMQDAFDSIAPAPYSNLIRFKGEGGLKITDTTTFFFRPPSNMSIHGDYTNKTTIIGGWDRNPLAAIFYVEHQNNVSFQGLRFIGYTYTHCDPIQPDNCWEVEGPLESKAIQIDNSAAYYENYTINSCEFVSRRFAISVDTAKNTNIIYNQIEMKRHPNHNETEGEGAALWIRNTQDTKIIGNYITSPDYYYAGIPDEVYEPRTPKATGIKAKDQIAIYGGKRIEILQNILEKGNTSGIWINCLNIKKTVQCMDTNRYAEDVIIYDNDISKFRQHGIDIAYATSGQNINTGKHHMIVSNTVFDTELSSLSFGHAHYFYTAYNKFNRACTAPWPLSILKLGTINLLEGSSNNFIYHNEVYGTNNQASCQDAVHFCDASNYQISYCGDEESINNVVTQNTLWRGAEGYVGGKTTNNSIYGNTEY